MSDLGGAAEIFEQTSLRVNEHTKRGQFGWAIPPHIEKASAAREKKKTAKPIATKRPPVESAVNPPTVSTCIARPVAGYKGLGQRFLGSNHIRPSRRVCKTMCG